jgi:simple sugar transport system permease protein
MENLILTIITAATPLLLAAIGELVAERSGVLNLGVEGMMVMGAVSAFGAALFTGWPLVGALAAISAGMAMALIFACLTLSFAANQVATGLALTIIGLGLSGLLGEPLVGEPGVTLQPIKIPLLTAIPHIGPILFGQDVIAYLSVALAAAASYVLFSTRLGLIIRAVGSNPGSAHALGYPVIPIRYGCVLFGGATAGLAGGYLSLVYTPQWVENMTAGRGWIALALVVFAAWRPWRLVLGAYLFGTVMILGLESQARGLGVPPQLLAALPYLVTILALVLISGTRMLKDAGAPASLGQPFVPER